MSKLENGGPAFPHVWTDTGEPAEIAAGMTLRDYFAASALQGIIACVRDHTGACSVNSRVAKAFEYADAMLKAREA